MPLILYIVIEVVVAVVAIALFNNLLQINTNQQSENELQRFIK